VVIVMNDGVPGEKSISVACMHCTDAPCAAVCPVDCFYTTDDGIVLHDKDLCIGCGYCFYACPFGAPQYPQQSRPSACAARWTSAPSARVVRKRPSKPSSTKYGANRIAEGKLPLCAEMCSTKALLAGDGDVLADIYRKRVMRRGGRPQTWGWLLLTGCYESRDVTMHDAGVYKGKIGPARRAVRRPGPSGAAARAHDDGANRPLKPPEDSKMKSSSNTAQTSQRGGSRVRLALLALLGAVFLIVALP
jgi:formate dehydrogenase iron-sulfur subunit